ncbi:MAG TPA: type IV secretion system DNA-binding domain-containing protein [Candidatus Paceibacterota bacterium]|nr:type IV secretion system DNA-binding domain-containing protein [Candidatus Pacearchaeota archaeon]HRZ50651.1 type IV secretion system DNA-binding domain-containing protein [Candidatus Paceibacterota bacterium]HSA36452.1 type IV secretion system DNA-binding domain-containing protein [Candidatus Paceibacterota bacterium]
MEEDKIAYIGEINYRNVRKKFGIRVDDRRRHMYVVGKTGMGKSSLLENMAIQDIQNGHGMAFIDPHGEAAQKLLDYVPQSRVNDVVYFNPSDLDYPLAFNVMENVAPEYRHLVASGLMGVFKKIWPDVWSARMEYILNNSILALLEYPNATLLGVNRMMSDTDFRSKVVEKITDPIIKSFWVNEFAKYNQRYESEATAAIQNKIGQFISNPLVRNIIGQVKTDVDMRKIMDEKKILIVNISKGLVGEDNSRLLGALVITKLQLAAMSRVDIPEEQRCDFYLYVDEFQNFATDAFVNILSEARKYRLNLTLANQYLGQLEEMTSGGKSSKVKDAVFGNIGTIIAFRVGAEDGEFLEKEFYPEILIEDLINLGKYNIYLKLMIDGIASAPFLAQTLPPILRPDHSEKEKIIRVTRERYAVPRSVIEEKIAKWTGEINNDAPPAAGQPKPLYDIQCSMCGKTTKVVFKPEPGRKVYCKTCLKKVQSSNEGPRNYPPRNGDNGYARPPFEDRNAASNNHLSNRERICERAPERESEKVPEKIPERIDEKIPPAIPQQAERPLKGADDQPVSQPAAKPAQASAGSHISLSSLAGGNIVRFSGRKEAGYPQKQRKEVQIDELKKILEETIKNKPDGQA